MMMHLPAKYHHSGMDLLSSTRRRCCGSLSIGLGHDSDHCVVDSSSNFRHFDVGDRDRYHCLGVRVPLGHSIDPSGLCCWLHQCRSAMDQPALVWRSRLCSVCLQGQADL